MTVETMNNKRAPPKEKDEATMTKKKNGKALRSLRLLMKNATTPSSRKQATPTDSTSTKRRNKSRNKKRLQAFLAQGNESAKEARQESVEEEDLTQSTVSSDDSASHQEEEHLHIDEEKPEDEEPPTKGGVKWSAWVEEEEKRRAADPNRRGILQRRPKRTDITGSSRREQYVGLIERLKKQNKLVNVEQRLAYIICQQAESPPTRQPGKRTRHQESTDSTLEGPALARAIAWAHTGEPSAELSDDEEEELYHDEEESPPTRLPGKRMRQQESIRSTDTTLEGPALARAIAWAPTGEPSAESELSDDEEEEVYHDEDNY